MEKVSVVIPTYGRTSSLREAINSVLKQTYRNIEVVVVDDNEKTSADRKKTEELISEYEGDTRIKYICMPHNSGAASSRNEGVKQANGKYIAFLDNDDLYLPSYIAEMYSAIKHGKTDVAYAGLWYISNGGKAISRKKLKDKREGLIWMDVLSGRPNISIFLMFKKTIVEDLGLFDSDLPSYEDYDLWLRWSKEKLFTCMDKPLAIVRRDLDTRTTSDKNKLYKGLQKIQSKWIPLLNEEEKSLFLTFVTSRKRMADWKELMLLNAREPNRYSVMKREFKSKYNLSYVEKIQLATGRLDLENTFIIRIIKATIFRSKYDFIDLGQV